mmetsp:Transcript_5711/g.18056  ORF Transcript_5711/g.18056 Transcript_5711/m.18056 type:complete len:235 (-) Transcript_5711:509-1213(-)
MTSAPAKMDWAVQRASLQLLFLSSVARTAPRCWSIFCRQSTPPESRESHSLRAYAVMCWVPLCFSTRPWSSVLATIVVSPSLNLRYRYATAAGRDFWVSSLTEEASPAPPNGLGSSIFLGGTSVRRICCEKFWLIIVASIDNFSGELMSNFGSWSSWGSCGGSCDVSDTVKKSKAAVSRLSKTNAPPSFCTTTSHGYTDRGEAISNEKIASVPYTCPACSSANFSTAGSSVVDT